jgi:hypothetical protein
VPGTVQTTIASNKLRKISRLSTHFRFEPDAMKRKIDA